MAETRKHNPRTSSIGERVREAIGGMPRMDPVDGAEPGVGDDPFVSAPEPGEEEPRIVEAAAGPLGGYTLLAGEQPGLVTVSPDQLSRLATVIRTTEAAGDDEDEDWDADEDWDDEPDNVDGDGTRQSS